MSWRDIPGWVDEHIEELYTRAVRDALASHRSLFVEIGVAFGRSAGLMATLIEASEKPIRFVAVDSFEVTEWKEPELTERIRHAGNFHHACLHELRTHLSPAERLRVEVLCMTSEQAAHHVIGAVDFCFLDGWHDEESVRRDLEAWVPKMRSGGVIGGHDHTGNYPGVAAAVRAKFGDMGIGYQIQGTCWWHQI